MSFELKPKISISEKDFFLKFGPNSQEVKKKIQSATFERDENCCRGCQYRARNLFLHLIEENERDLENSSFVSLCKACHTTQHIDKAIAEGWVMVVNSTFTQKSLIEICRHNRTHEHLKDGSIRVLKITPEEYAIQLKENTLPLHSRVKVIFTSKFEWGEL
jgi:hypothetical protein